MGLFSSKSSSTVNKEYVTHTESSTGDIGFTGQNAVDFVNLIQAGEIARSKIAGDVMMAASAKGEQQAYIESALGGESETGFDIEGMQQYIIPGIAVLAVIFAMKGGF